MARATRWLASFVLGAPLLSGAACSRDVDVDDDGPDLPSPDSTNDAPEGDVAGGGSAGSPNTGEPWSLPAGFTPSTFGGYRLGPPLVGAVDPADLLPPGDEEKGCGTTIVGVIRDMKVEHDDFEDFCCGLRLGLVEEILGADRKPVYAPAGATSFTSGPSNFIEWYRDVEGVNLPYLVYLALEPNAGVFTFHSSSFFPLDGEGFGDQLDTGHNFHFTTEVHAKFVYRGGETFRFVGDDDVWVFLNQRLVIDLGGVHDAATEEVELDAVAEELGLELGAIYPLDLFHAERRTTESNFRIDMTLRLVDCGSLVDVPLAE